MTENKNPESPAEGESRVSVSKALVPRRVYYRRAAQKNGTRAAAVPPEPTSKPESLGRTLSRQIRLGVLRQAGDQAVKDAHDLMEAWHEEQHEVVRDAAARLEALPGLVIESAFKQATESALRHRAHIYAKKTFFFEDCEALVHAIERYAATLARPHDMRRQALAAAAKMVELLGEGVRNRDPRIARARRVLMRAKLARSNSAMETQARRVRVAREAMIEARQHVECEFYVTSFGGVQTSPPHPYTAQGSQERQSDSNRVQLKPRSGLGP